LSRLLNVVIVAYECPQLSCKLFETTSVKVVWNVKYKFYK